MSRLKRRNRTLSDVGFKESGGALDLIDNVIKESFRINDAEFDFICENAEDGELESLISDALTFSEKRRIIEVLNKYLTKFEEANG